MRRIFVVICVTFESAIFETNNNEKGNKIIQNKPKLSFHFMLFIYLE